MLIKFDLPFRLILAGGSGSGKTEILKRFLSSPDDYFDDKFDKVLYFTKTDPDPELYRLSTQTFNRMPTDEDLVNDERLNILIIIDDFGFEASKSELVCKIFQSGRHENLSCILTLQNLFERGCMNRSVSLSASHMVLTRPIRDKNQSSHLSFQMYPEHRKLIPQIFSKFITTPFSFLLINLRQHIPDCIRLQSDFDGESVCVYMSKREYDEISRGSCFEA